MLWETWASLAQGSFLTSLQAMGHPRVPCMAMHLSVVLGDTARDKDNVAWEQPQGRSWWSCECKHLGLSPKYCCLPTGLESLPRLERWDVEGC